MLDAFFTLAILLALDCLRRGDYAGWAAGMILASLVFYAGVVVLLLCAAAALLWQPDHRKQMLRAAAVGIAVLLGIACFYFVWACVEGSVHGWGRILYEAQVEKYFRPIRPTGSAPELVGYFLLGCGAIAALGLVLPFCRKSSQQQDASQLAWERTAATVVLIYLLIILGSQYRNLHYLGPLLPITVVLWLRSSRTASGRATSDWIAPVFTAALLLVSTYFCWPASRRVFTLNRQLGELTTFQTDSYEEACAWSKIIHPLYHRGQISWQLGPQTWSGYSQRAARPANPRPLLVTIGRPPSGYQLLLETGQQAKLYCNDPKWTGWLKSQHPAAGPARFPRVLQAVAIRPAPQESIAERTEGP